VTSITLDHTLYTGLSNQPNGITNVNNNNNFPNNNNNIFNQNSNSQNNNNNNFNPNFNNQNKNPNINNNNNNNFNNINQRPITQAPPQQPINQFPQNSGERVGEFTSQCGVPQFRFPQSTGLVVNGKSAVKGQFPWLAAYYHNEYGNSGFICGGSLVSSKVIITAAHCIHDKGASSRKRKAEEAQFYLGKYYLESQTNERDFLISGAQQFIIHPDWNVQVESYDADIAAVILIRTVQFTNFIRPICVWTETNNKNDIVNKRGIVAGYGKTEKSVSASDKPYWSELPVVSDVECLRSNSVFGRITSENTFCAGSRDGSGPCNGWCNLFY
jgi:hypothetical protein